MKNINKDYRIEMRVKNNRIMSLIERKGFSSVAEFSETNRLNHNQVYRLINLRHSPLDRKGNFRKIVIDIAEILDVVPSELFNHQQMYFPIEENKKTIEVNAEQIYAITQESSQLSLEEGIAQENLSSLLLSNLEKLTPREQKVIKMRFGIDTIEHTYEEIGRELDISRERVRQIEASSLRKMRRPSISNQLREFICST